MGVRNEMQGKMRSNIVQIRCRGLGARYVTNLHSHKMGTQHTQTHRIRVET